MPKDDGHKALNVKMMVQTRADQPILHAGVQSIKLAYPSSVIDIEAAKAAVRAEAFREAAEALKLRASEYRNGDDDRWLEASVMSEAADIIEAKAK